MTPTRSQGPATRLAKPLLALLLALASGPLAGSACSKDTPAASPPPQSQGDAATTADGPATKPDQSTTGAPDGSGSGSPDLGSAVDSQPPPTTCASLRNCVTRCATDTACQQKCIAAAPTAARDAYATVTTCSKKGCTDFNDEICRCPRECMADGECTELVDTCRDFDMDEFCEMRCGS
jgi:hypothetical protein